ncbi:MAG: hypothetical protein BWY85_01988 [Firmicutes bacterium ADurb.Bin506]|nr:MAG: hypothetical protein BWY85_01988 [Firmicutes bacterium ADurb.Bin506]
MIIALITSALPPNAPSGPATLYTKKADPTIATATPYQSTGWRTIVVRSRAKIAQPAPACRLTSVRRVEPDRGRADSREFPQPTTNTYRASAMAARAARGAAAASGTSDVRAE